MLAEKKEKKKKSLAPCLKYKLPCEQITQSRGHAGSRDESAKFSVGWVPDLSFKPALS